MASVQTEIIPYLMYRDVPAALDWLARAFGFTETLRHETPGGGMHAEMRLDGCRIMLGQHATPEPAGAVTLGVFVYLPEVDAHYQRARDAGAAVDQPPRDHGYGRTYTARDLDGHIWYFTTPPA